MILLFVLLVVHRGRVLPVVYQQSILPAAFVLNFFGRCNPSKKHAVITSWKRRAKVGRMEVGDEGTVTLSRHHPVGVAVVVLQAEEKTFVEDNSWKRK